MIEFANPQLLLLAPFLIGVAVISHFFSQKIKKSLEVFHFPPVPRLIKIGTKKGMKRHFWRGINLALKIALVVLITMSLARPTVSTVTELTRSVDVPMVEEKDVMGGIVLTIDVSASMGLPDVTPSRLEAAKTGLLAFVQNASEKVRFGVVAFDSEIKNSLPITEDKQQVVSAIQELKPSEGLPCLEELTDIGYGLQTAIDLLTPYASSNSSYAVVLVSDGFTNYGHPDAYASVQNAVQIATDRSVPVYAVHVAVTGQDSNPALLEWITTQTKAKFMYSSTMEELSAVLYTLSKYHTPTNAWTAKVDIKTTIPQQIDIGNMLMLAATAVVFLLWIGNYRHYKTWF